MAIEVDKVFLFVRTLRMMTMFIREGAPKRSEDRNIALTVEMCERHVLWLNFAGPEVLATARKLSARSRPSASRV